MATAFAAGQWQRIQANQEALPYLRYNASAAGNPREAHKRFYGLILPVSHPIWKQIYPPNGYGCLCSVSQLTRGQAEKQGISDEPDIQMVEFTNPRTGEVVTIPASVTPSFAHNHTDRLGNARTLFADKHGQAAAKVLDEQLSEHMIQRVNRPNFFGETPPLTVLQNFGVENAQELVFNYAGRGYQLELGKIGEINSAEWFIHQGQHYVIEYHRDGVELSKIDPVDLLSTKEGFIRYIGNQLLGNNDLDILADKDIWMRSGSYATADYADQMAAFIYTCNDGYQEINPSLIQAKGALGQLSENKNYLVKMLDGFLQQAPKYTGTTTRIMDTSKMENAQYFLNAHAVGGLIRYSNFTSTTKGGAFGKSMDVDVELTIHGQSGVDITKLSRYQSENEVLMPRHAVYVVKNHTVTDGVHHIILEEVTETEQNRANIVQLSLPNNRQNGGDANDRTLR